MSVFIGIDPGITGAFAAVNWRGEVLALGDLPVMATTGGKVSRMIDPAALKGELRDLLASGDAMTAAVEKIASMPGQGVASMFSMGDTFGTIRAVLACSSVPTEFPTSGLWKRAMALDSDKEKSRARAIQLFPGESAKLKLKKHHNRAEALLLAEWLRRKRA
jgi:crossover junction endodeoxyribonuclease RuvC